MHLRFQPIADTNLIAIIALKLSHLKVDQVFDRTPLCTRQTSAGAVAQKLAVSRPTLYKWKNQLLGREVPTSMKLHNDSLPDPERSDLEQQVEALQRGIQRLQLEHDLLKKANELLKKGLGVDLQLLSNREKTLLVDALKHTYALSDLLA